MKILLASVIALGSVTPVLADDVIEWETTSQTTWKEIHIEYGHEMKERE